MRAGAILERNAKAGVFRVPVAAPTGVNQVVDQRGGPVEMDGIALQFTGSTISYEERDRMPDEDTKDAKKPTIQGGPQNVSEDSGCGF